MEGKIYYIILRLEIYVLVHCHCIVCGQRAKAVLSTAVLILAYTTLLLQEILGTGCAYFAVTGIAVKRWIPDVTLPPNKETVMSRCTTEAQNMAYTKCHTWYIQYQMLPLYFPPLSRIEQRCLVFDPNALNSNRLRIWDTDNQYNILNINIFPRNED